MECKRTNAKHLCAKLYERKCERRWCWQLDAEYTHTHFFCTFILSLSIVCDIILHIIVLSFASCAWYAHKIWMWWGNRAIAFNKQPKFLKWKISSTQYMCLGHRITKLNSPHKPWPKIRLFYFRCQFIWKFNSQSVGRIAKLLFLFFILKLWFSA